MSDEVFGKNLIGCFISKPGFELHGPDVPDECVETVGLKLKSGSIRTTEAIREVAKCFYPPLRAYCETPFKIVDILRAERVECQIHFLNSTSYQFSSSLYTLKSKI